MDTSCTTTNRPIPALAYSVNEGSGIVHGDPGDTCSTKQHFVCWELQNKNLAPKALKIPLFLAGHLKSRGGMVNPPPPLKVSRLVHATGEI